MVVCVCIILGANYFLSYHFTSTEMHKITRNISDSSLLFSFPGIMVIQRQL